MIELQRKSASVQGWNLTNQTEMLDALSHLSGSGWRGAISFNSVSATWRLELNADSPTRQIIADTGDWLVLDVGLRKLTSAEVEANYEVEGS